MRALIFNKDLSLTDIENPERKSGESLIRVTKAGICNTDLEITKGYMGFSGVPGHEFVGIVEESDNLSFIGQRVVGEINAGCGECEKCIAGDTRHCPDRTVLGMFRRNGAFADYLTLPDKNLLKIPDTVSDDSAVFIEPLAAAVHVFDEDVFRTDIEFAVIGDGKLGLLTALAGKALGYNPLLIGRHEAKMNIAARAGIETKVSETKLANKYPAVVECSGNPGGLETATKLIQPQGTIILKSTFAPDSEGRSILETIDLSKTVVDEVTIAGSRCGRFRPALELLSLGKIDPTPLITATYPIDQILKAFAHARRKDALKVLIDIDMEQR